MKIPFGPTMRRVMVLPLPFCLLWTMVLGLAACNLVGASEDFGPRRDLVERLNTARSSMRMCGSVEFDAAPPLAWNDRLAESALRHSRDLSENGGGGHTGSDGSTPAQRIREAGYRASTVAEVVAVGKGSAGEIVRAWLDSPGHCAAIMNPRVTEAGAALRGLVWTVDMAEPSS